MFAFALASFSQTQTTQIDPTNVRQGETVEYCVTHKKHQELLANPAAVAVLAQDEQIRQNEAAIQLPFPREQSTRFLLYSTYYTMEESKTSATIKSWMPSLS